MKNQFADPALSTLADVAAQILKAEDLSTSRKASVRSAINTAARWFKLPPSATRAHPELLRKLFEGFAPAGASVTPKRVSNVKSDLLFALRHLGFVAGGSYLAPMAPGWKALWDKILNQGVPLVGTWSTDIHTTLKKGNTATYLHATALDFDAFMRELASTLEAGGVEGWQRGGPTNHAYVGHAAMPLVVGVPQGGQPWGNRAR